MQHQSDGDRRLVESARAGDHAAFAALVVRHRPLAMRVSAHVVRDWATLDDVVQEAVLQAWLSLDKLRRPERFGPWLAGIALHIAHRWSGYSGRDVWSLEAVLGGRFASEPVDTDPDPAVMAEVREFDGQVHRAIADLPPGQRSAVALFYLADLSYAEVAGLLGIQVGAVKTRLHKARGQLRRALVDLSIEEHMTTHNEYVDVDVEDVRVVTVDPPPGERSVVLLAERAGERLLPIWVGRFEGDAIAIGFVGAETSRPLTHAFATQLLAAAGGRLKQVRIERLAEETYYAQALLDTQTGDKFVDARPSDAIALALDAGAPIRVSAEVMQEAGLTRAELAQKRPMASSTRSAREHAAEIRERLTQPRAAWSSSTLF